MNRQDRQEKQKQYEKSTSFTRNIRGITPCCEGALTLAGDGLTVLGRISSNDYKLSQRASNHGNK